MESESKLISKAAQKNIDFNGRNAISNKSNDFTVRNSTSNAAHINVNFDEWYFIPTILSCNNNRGAFRYQGGGGGCYLVCSDSRSSASILVPRPLSLFLEYRGIQSCMSIKPFPFLYNEYTTKVRLRLLGYTAQCNSITNPSS